MSRADPYEPINTLKPTSEGIWIVDGPIIRMKAGLGCTVPFQTRMTVIRLSNGGLWLHSPIALDEGLVKELKRAFSWLG